MFAMKEIKGPAASSRECFDPPILSLCHDHIIMDTNIKYHINMLILPFSFTLSHGMNFSIYEDQIKGNS